MSQIMIGTYIGLPDMEWYKRMYQNALQHYGVPTQKWGERQYQNEDGTYTALGRLHYGIGPPRKEAQAKALLEGFDRQKGGIIEDTISDTKSLLLELRGSKKSDRLRELRMELTGYQKVIDTLTADPDVTKAIAKRMYETFKEIRKDAEANGVKINNFTQEDFDRHADIFARKNIAIYKWLLDPNSTWDDYPVSSVSKEDQEWSNKFITHLLENQHQGYEMPYWSTETNRKFAGIIAQSSKYDYRTDTELRNGYYEYLDLNETGSRKSKPKSKELKKRWKREPVDKETGFHVAEYDYSDPEQAIQQVNDVMSEKDFDGSHKKPKNPYRTNNCSSCALAYEMRRRGYDVLSKEQTIGTFEAETLLTTNSKDVGNITTSGMKNSAHKKYENIKDYVTLYKEVTKDRGEYLANKMEKELKKFGDDSRGLLSVQWTSGGGHSMFYEMKGGNLLLVDPQTHQVMDVKSEKAMYYLAHMMDVAYQRTDNLSMSDFDIKALKKYVY